MAQQTLKPPKPPVLFCEQCRYGPWTPRQKPNRPINRPKACPNCGRRDWAVPRRVASNAS
mgnify:CR=1 FL=1